MILNGKPKTREEVIARYLDNDFDVSRLLNLKITLKVDDVEYLVDMIDTYELGKPIRLPDGRVFEVGGWFECLPPMPGGVTEVVDMFKDQMDAAEAVLKNPAPTSPEI